MLLEKLVAGVREFLSPKEPNVITELDLAHCLGRRVEIEAASGVVMQLSVGGSARVVGEAYVDNVMIDNYRYRTSPVVMQRALRIGESMAYADTIDGFADGLYVTRCRIIRITVLY